MKALGKPTLVLILALFCLMVASASGESAPSTLLQRPSIASEESVKPQVAASDRDSYHGFLRIYIEEPVSRYRDYSNKNYNFGFLGFAVNQAITVNDGEVLTDTVIWNVGSFGAVSQTNIEAIAVVATAEGVPAYSNPSDNTFPFTAYYVDAAASSKPGIVGIDDANGSYTHTVFLEEATSST